MLKMARTVILGWVGAGFEKEPKRWKLRAQNGKKGNFRKCVNFALKLDRILAGKLAGGLVVLKLIFLAYFVHFRGFSIVF